MDDLLPLPRPVAYKRWPQSLTGDPAIECALFTTDQMRAYAAACVAAERERCAKLCEQQRVGIDAFGGIEHHIHLAIEQCAAAIREE